MHELALIDGELITDITQLSGSGDFRSPECIEILAACDIVVTNPPFSLFREFFDLVHGSAKDIIILCGVLAVSYTTVFPHIWSGKVATGHHRVHWFNTPATTETTNIPANWLTTLLDIEDRKFLPLTALYTGREDYYQRFDGYDIINVDRVVNIPSDYYGAMAVPITFLHKYNPNQFEILKPDGLNNESEGNATKMDTLHDAKINGKISLCAS